MIDITSIQTFTVLPELQILNNENIALKKENIGIKMVLTTFVFLTLGVGLYKLIQYQNEEHR